MKICEVCEILKIDEDVIVETDLWRLSLARHDQYYLGRSYLTCKRHVGDLAELTKSEWDELQALINRYELAIRTAFGAVVFNWSCLTNNAFQTKPYDPHIHWHIRPRYDKSVKFGGSTYVDPEFGHHYKRGTENSVDSNISSEIIKAIRKYI